jgi:hypothetical protein
VIRRPHVRREEKNRKAGIIAPDDERRERAPKFDRTGARSLTVVDAWFLFFEFTVTRYGFFVKIFIDKTLNPATLSADEICVLFDDREA